MLIQILKMIWKKHCFKSHKLVALFDTYQQYWFEKQNLLTTLSILLVYYFSNAQIKSWIPYTEQNSIPFWKYRFKTLFQVGVKRQTIINFFRGPYLSPEGWNYPNTEKQVLSSFKYIFSIFKVNHWIKPL